MDRTPGKWLGTTLGNHINQNMIYLVRDSTTTSATSVLSAKETAMNLVKLDPQNRGTEYLNIDTIICVFKSLPKEDTVECLLSHPISPHGGIGIQFAANPNKIHRAAIVYDEGIWNRFILEPGWIISADKNTIVNSKYVISVSELGGKWFVFIPDEHQINPDNGKLVTGYQTIEIDEHEFRQRVLRKYDVCHGT